MNILAIETSCDETAAAVVENGTRYVSSAVASSSMIHKKYGGIVPELAARAQIESIIPVITEALSIFRFKDIHEPYLETIQNHIDSIAVTVGPGLIGSLLVGVETAKTISFATGIQIIPINHVIAHMYANLIQDESSDKNYKLPAENKKTITFPAISLVASGGHTELFLMESEKHITWLGGTLDDAAGEAFDKTARLLGFENSGGKAIEKAAQMCTNSYKFSPRNKTIALPRPYLPDQPYNFSFSGLKAAAMRIVNTLKDQKQFNNATIQSCAYEIQESITDVLVKKTINAAKAYKAKFILVSGGVASNMRLRKKFDDAIQRCNQAAAHNPYSELHFSAPPIALCMDNAVSIGACAHFIGSPASVYTITAKPDLPVEVKI